MLQQRNIDEAATAAVRSSYGELIRRRRKLLGRTQQDIADYVGVNRRLISEVENGSISVSLKHFVAICEAVGLEMRVTATYRDGT